MTPRSLLRTAADLANTYFVALVILAAAAALAQPSAFTWIAPYISPLLGLIMLGMGLTLKLEDFRRLADRPRDVALGAAAQWIIMPLAAYGLTIVLSLPPELAVGVILVGAAPGGTASNVMAYLGEGDVALSVAITTVTTLAAPVVMPAWVVALAGEQLQVGFVDLFVNILQIVFIPVVLGFVLRHLLDQYAPTVAEVGLDVFPLVSVLSIVAIVAAVVGLNVDTILGAGVAAITVVVLHNAIGLGAGYSTGRLAGMPEDRVRTTTFEVGLQNSGLAAALAVSFFSPLAALPPALFSIWHNITGPALASYFARSEQKIPSGSPADD